MPASGALFGAYVDPDNHYVSIAQRESDTTTFESQIGRKLDVNHHYHSWSGNFPDTLEQWDIANGRTPLISWDGTTLDSITNGSNDSLITTRADAVKAVGAPIFLRWGWEMNGNWYAWDGTHNANDPSKYVAAWRHIHDIFVARGATNAVWVWNPNHESVPNTSWNAVANYYPGDSYVDWVGIDGYNMGTTQSWSSFQSFESLMRPVYDAYAARKPIMIGETSSLEQGGSKSAWTTAVGDAIKSRMPAIKALLWFDVHKTYDWRPDSTADAMTAYIALAQDAYFRR